ncbi:hypothetical protein RND81_05G252400 [Saponaria officinalis]|uniref:Water stress and hypersensitive response domain-containing protein n=1 Tax=Saponaria officinalis TaxID=3572 RepID=A0AAW1L284_SAPOF
MWSWTSAVIGAATGAATAAIVAASPRDPVFELISIDLTTFKLNLSGVDVDLIITVHLNNPNMVPVHYASATMTIFYDGASLGSARLDAGSQSARSCRLIRLPARLNGAELLAHHKGRFMADVAKREMVIVATVDVEGAAKVGWWWDHRFRVHVESRVSVDPVFLDVIEQDNKSEMDLFVTN